MDNTFEPSVLEFQQLAGPDSNAQKIKLSIARLDKLHAGVSGNKLFKLHYFLEAAIASSHKRIITFGGAYSNHLVATAFACSVTGLQAIGIVRGEEPKILSHTLQQCKTYGMRLHFVSRAEYKDASDPEFLLQLKAIFGACIVIPEGGFHHLGAQGAAMIMQRVAVALPTHVCVPVGTATTLAGLLSAAKEEAIVGIPVIKNMTDIQDRIRQLTGLVNSPQLSVMQGYDFGGYAKSTPALFAFMNEFFRVHKVPLDFVYTAKMMFGIMEKIKEGYFPDGSHVMCLHTGGLQGNKSLAPEILIF